jgi:uncharacterized membrane protein
MLVVFPLGLFTVAVIFDVLYLITRNPNLPVASYYMIAAGLVGGLLAAIFGAIDWSGLPYNSRAWNMGLGHGIGNMLVMGLFLLSWLRRGTTPELVPNPLALFSTFAGLGVALFTGWIGGELVYRLRVGVDRDAHLDAPSSLAEPSREPSKVERP